VVDDSTRSDDGVGFLPLPRHTITSTCGDVLHLTDFRDGRPLLTITNPSGDVAAIVLNEDAVAQLIATLIEVQINGQ
jgi:hypothetical protein